MVEKLHGATIYIPFTGKRKVAISGYFEDDPINMGRQRKQFNTKHQDILRGLYEMNVPSKFAIGYYDQISVRDFLLKSQPESYDDISEAFSE